MTIVILGLIMIVKNKQNISSLILEPFVFNIISE